MNANLTDDCKAYIKTISKIKTTKNLKAKKLSGYNVFTQELRKTLTGAPTEIMKELGALWKDCSKKDFYNQKAAKLNAVAAKEAEETQVVDDAQTLELSTAISELIKQFKKDLKKKKSADNDAADE